MLKLLILTYVIAYCSAGVIKDTQPEVLNPPGNGVEETNENQSSDLETAEFKHIGFGPKVVVINKGYGGHHGGHYGGRGCACGGYGSSHYHSHHRYYGKKK